MINKTQFNIEVAHVLLDEQHQHYTQLSRKEIDYIWQVQKTDKNTSMKNLGITMMMKQGADLERLSQFQIINPGEEFRIPLLWFFEEIAITLDDQKDFKVFL